MTYDLDIWHGGSSWPCKGQIRRTKFTVKNKKCSLFSAMDDEMTHFMDAAHDVKCSTLWFEYFH